MKGRQDQAKKRSSVKELCSTTTGGPVARRRRSVIPAPAVSSMDGFTFEANRSLPAALLSNRPFLGYFVLNSLYSQHGFGISGASPCLYDVADHLPIALPGWAPGFKISGELFPFF